MKWIQCQDRFEHEYHAAKRLQGCCIMQNLKGSFHMTFHIIFFILKKEVDVPGFLMNFFNKMILKRRKR